jgi:hypothetical protein
MQYVLVTALDSAEAINIVLFPRQFLPLRIITNIFYEFLVSSMHVCHFILLGSIPLLTCDAEYNLLMSLLRNFHHPIPPSLSDPYILLNTLFKHLQSASFL